ncbi:MAG: hypothetical protein KAW41_06745 [Candidatus Diapherotrites archaeon]|nr:hypothetical protein [Candidatus Diapherotrites archaeon]
MAQLLEKMIYHGWIGGKHTSADNLPKSFPRHARDKVKKALKQLVGLGFIVVKPTSYGKELSINPRAVKEIKQFILEQRKEYLK